MYTYTHSPKNRKKKIGSQVQKKSQIVVVTGNLSSSWEEDQDCWSLLRSVTFYPYPSPVEPLNPPKSPPLRLVGPMKSGI